MQRELPPLNQLRSFEAAARHQSFVDAADELNVTPAAVSRLVKALEEYLGLSLFHRGAAHVTLTRLGAQYLARLTPALDEIAIATSELTGNWQSKLTVAAFPSVAQRWLIPLWAEFNKAHPNMKMEIKTSMVPPGYGSDEIDACIRVVPPNDTSLIWEKIHDDALIPVCSPKLDLEDTSAPFMKIHCRTRATDWQMWQEHCGEAPSPKNQLDGMEFDTLLSAIEAAIQGIGVAITLKSVVGPELSSGALVPAFPEAGEIPCPYYLTYPQDRAQHPTLRAFQKFVSDQYKNS